MNSNDLQNLHGTLKEPAHRIKIQILLNAPNNTQKRFGRLITIFLSTRLFIIKILIINHNCHQKIQVATQVFKREIKLGVILSLLISIE